MQIRHAESLKQLNTLALAASASALATVETGAELQQALDWASAEGLPVLPLGEGSNVVLCGELEALVLYQAGAAMQVVEEQGDRVRLRVQAGHSWHSLVCRSLQRGFYGLENLALIPGQVGAAPIQNIGAYGVELDRFIHAVHGVHISSGDAFSFSRADCDFGYRESVFKKELRDQVVITAVELDLSTAAAPHVEYPALVEEIQRLGGDAGSPGDVFNAVVSVRRRKLPDPATEPNAGSFFKNPVVSAEHAATLSDTCPDLPRYPQANGEVKLAAAWLIERAGWKGLRREGVGVHPDHALVLVNYTADNGSILLHLAADIRRSVEDAFGVSLELEPRVYGHEPV